MPCAAISQSTAQQLLPFTHSYTRLHEHSSSGERTLWLSEARPLSSAAHSPPRRLLRCLRSIVGQEKLGDERIRVGFAAHWAAILAEALLILLSPPLPQTESDAMKQACILCLVAALTLCSAEGESRWRLCACHRLPPLGSKWAAAHDWRLEAELGPEQRRAHRHFPAHRRAGGACRGRVGATAVVIFSVSSTHQTDPLINGPAQRT